MSHTFVNGFGGSITFSSQTLDVGTWTLTQSADLPDTTNTGDAGWESNIVGAKAWEGSAETWWDSAAVPTGTAGFTPGARATVVLNVSNTGKSYTGTCSLTKVEVKNEAKGAVTFSISFKGTGSLTEAT